MIDVLDENYNLPLENEEVVEMFKICVDENNYFTTGEGKLVEVAEMPTNLENVNQLLAYRYNEETKLLELDEDKLVEVNNQIEALEKVPTDAERLADVENALMELSRLICNKLG